MKKVLLISVCLIVSVLLGGGKSWASDNVNFSISEGTLTINVSGETSNEDESSFASYLQNNKSFTKIVFTGGGKVSNNFVTKLNNSVSNVTSVDMGGVVIDELSQSSIPTGLNFANITEFVVPQTKTENGAMVFPKDVFTSYQWNANNNGDQHQTKLVFPEGYTAIADEAFCGQGYDYNWIASISFPSTLTTIGKKAFDGKQYLSEMNFPENLDKIDDAAFAFTKLHDFKFNSKLRYIGNSAFAYNNQQIVESTLTIPASVKYIGPAAFHFHKYQDVYFQGNRAPVMPYGQPVVTVSELGNNHVETTAFYCQVLMGYGCSPQDNKDKGTADNPTSGWANRENYINGTTYICVMHYPKTLTNEDDINTYVDVTRKYITTTFTSESDYSKAYQAGKENTALTASNGNTSAYNYGAGYVEYGYQDTYLGGQYIWPSQNQMKRAYITAVNGVKWDGITAYRTTLTEEEKAVLAEAGYTTENGYSEDDLQKMAHQGTRMFVLANNDAQTTPDYKPSIQKDGTWWTVCVPFNMTKKQVKEAFGEETQLCLFDEVTREIEVNGKNHILIRFATNPMKKKTADAEGKKMKWDANENADQENGHVAGEWKYSSINAEGNGEPEDNDIVIWAHESYMIKPMKGENSDQDPAVTIANLSTEPGNPLPSVVRAKTVRLTQDEGDYTDCYRFVGNYETDVKMPQYSYFFGTGTNDKTEKFRFYTGTESNWKANKSIIQASAHDGGAQDYKNFFGGNANNAKVMQSTVFGFDEDNNTTGIDDVKIVVGNDTLSPVFTLDGKMVNVSGDTTGLAKGVYVKAGKKFIVQ